MASIDRPSGYFETWDPITGRRVSGETRSCVHCGTTWIYDPKESFRRKLGLVSRKPKTRGTCIKCHGFVCAEAACLKRGCVPKMKQIEEMEQAGRNGSGLILPSM